MKETYESRKLEYDREFCNYHMNISFTKITITEKNGKLIKSLNEIHKLLVNILDDGIMIKSLKINP